MKKIILSLLTILFAFTFSFSQNSSKEAAANLKKNSILVVDYLTEELKLQKEQKAVCANVFAEYANNLAKLNDKLNARSKGMNDKEKSRMTLEYMAEFTKVRDKKLTNVLNEKQIEKYKKISGHYDPMTLTMKKKKRK
tara:strand:- start:4 stop:417 length:414 start_codon:yes stop_codon:yes gene_type:complete